MPEEEKVYGGMGLVIDALMEDASKPSEDKPDENDPPIELKFGDEGYILKEGDEGYVIPDPEVIDYNTFEKEELVNKVKDFEQLVSEREQSISRLESDLEARGSVEEDELVKSLSDNFIQNYDKVKKKYNLPSLTVLKDLMSEGASVDDKIKVWQESELTKAIEQEHSLEEGEFEYDSNEAAKAGTASYNWDTKTADKRSELVGHLKERQGAERSRLQKVEAQQQADIKWLVSESYYETEDVVTEKLNAMTAEVDLIAKGESTSDKHPFAVRNMLRGFFFDDLVKTSVDKAVQELVDQFAQHEMYLPNKELPTNVTQVKGSPPKPKEVQISEEDRKHSPMLSSIFNTANKT